MTDIPADFTTAATFEGNPFDMATFSGELESVGDSDWIKFTVTVDPNGFGATVFVLGCVDGALGGNSVLTLRDANGAVVNSNDNAPAGLNSFFAANLMSSGTYYLEVRSQDGWQGEYSLAVMGLGTQSFLGGGDDNVYLGMNNIIVGGDGDDTIEIVGFSNDILGEQGDDHLIGSSGRNRISGGLGNDNIEGRVGDDLLFGDAGHDQITGDEGNDVIYGGAGHDRLLGGVGSDTIFAGPGVDQCIGGAGNDVYHVDGTDQIVEGVGDGLDTVFTVTSFTLAAGQEIEDLLAESPLSTDPLNLIGNEFANSITGNNGANLLIGGAGSDVLRGLLGNDRYVLGSEATGVDLVIDTGGIDTITSSIARSLGSFGAIENLTLIGSDPINATGNALSNTLIGNAAANTLSGSTGNDRLIGLGGHDILLGGAGRDTLTGGLGNDVFRFTSRTQSPRGSADTITDFDDYGNDRIDLSSVYGSVLTYRHNLAFTAAGQVRINDIPGRDLIVEVNTGGSLAADMQIRLTATTLRSMSAEDFFL